MSAQCAKPMIVSNHPKPITVAKAYVVVTKINSALSRIRARNDRFGAKKKSAINPSRPTAKYVRIRAKMLRLASLDSATDEMTSLLKINSLDTNRLWLKISSEKKHYSPMDSWIGEKTFEYLAIHE